MAATKKRRKKSTSSRVPARRRSAPRAGGKTPARRRTKRRPGMLSASTNYKAIGIQVVMAVVGGVIGKVARNAMPASTSPEIKAAVVLAGGVMVAIATKQPMIGAGMIGSGGAYYASVFGEKNGIALLADQYNSGYSSLSEAQVYADEMGNPLLRKGDLFFYGNGAQAPYKPADFVRIGA